mgnify:CR=1 FL=1
MSSRRNAITTRLARRALIAGAVAALGLGVSAGAAHAISIDGIRGNPFNYTGVQTTQHRFAVNRGNIVVTCTTATFTGTATGAAWTDFQPTYSGCTFNLAGTPLPATVTVSSPWRLTALTTSGGISTGSIDLLSSRTTIRVPLLGCEVYVDGPQTFTHGDANGSIGTSRHIGTGELLTVVAEGVRYTVNNPINCTFGSGSDGRYHTGVDGVDIPGVIVNP